MPAMNDRIVIGITGASGAAYSRRILQLLAEAGVEIHLAVSSLGRRLLLLVDLVEDPPDGWPRSQPQLQHVSAHEQGAGWRMLDSRQP